MRRGFSVVKIFAGVWSQYYPGEEYYPTGGDYKLATDLDEMPPDEIIKRAHVFLKTDYHKINRHDFKVFHKHINRWVEEPKKTIPRPKELLISCSDCGTNHRVDELCPNCYPKVDGTKEDALRAIQDIARAFDVNRR